MMDKLVTRVWNRKKRSPEEDPHSTETPVKKLKRDGDVVTLEAMDIETGAPVVSPEPASKKHVREEQSEVTRNGEDTNCVSPSPLLQNLSPELTPSETSSLSESSTTPLPSVRDDDAVLKPVPAAELVQFVTDKVEKEREKKAHIASLADALKGEDAPDDVQTGEPADNVDEEKISVAIPLSGKKSVASVASVERTRDMWRDLLNRTDLLRGVLGKRVEYLKDIFLGLLDRTEMWGCLLGEKGMLRSLLGEKGMVRGLLGLRDMMRLLVGKKAAQRQLTKQDLSLGLLFKQEALLDLISKKDEIMLGLLNEKDKKGFLGKILTSNTLLVFLMLVPVMLMGPVSIMVQKGFREFVAPSICETNPEWLQYCSALAEMGRKERWFDVFDNLPDAIAE